MACLQRCDQCPNVSDPVPGYGDLSAKVVFVAEKPGHEEDKKGRPFCGRFGREFFDLYLGLTGLEKSEIYVTNALKCFPTFERYADEAIVECCASLHLAEEISTINPELIVLMGAAACHLVGLDVSMEHGRAHTVDFFGVQRRVYVMFHPALGMRDYAAMDNIMEDFHTLGIYLRTGVVDAPVDEYPDTRYERLHTPEEVRLSFREGHAESGDPLAIDTEYDIEPIGVDPYCLTYSHTPGEGFMIKVEDPPAVAEFARIVSGTGRGNLGVALPGETPKGGWRGLILLHNKYADLPPLDTMGVHINRKRVRDTMTLSYNLMKYPQGLKALAYRLVGMRMTEFDDLVTPYAIEYWLAYMEMLACEVWPKLEPYMRPTLVDTIEYVNEIPVKTGKHMEDKLYKPQSLTTKIKRLLGDYKKKPSPKLFKRWGEWDDVEKAPAIKAYGDLPRKSVRQVTDERALLNYACRDCDATLRVYYKELKLRREFRKRYHL